MRKGSEQPLFESVPCYVTTEVVAVGPETPLPELVQQFIDTRADRIIVRDEVGRPVGVISAADVLKAVAGAGDCGGGSRDPANKECELRREAAGK
jgi:CBS domain-containing protein